MQKPVLLTYNLKGDRGRRIHLLARRHNIHVRPVLHEELGRPIRDLISQDEQAFEPFDGEGFDSEMFIMARFPSSLISRFLDAFRQAGIQSVRLKAMLTETNGAWSSAHLHGELQQESAYFAQLRKMAHEKKPPQTEDAQPQTP